MTFLEKLDDQWKKGYAVCVSLDVDDRALNSSSNLGVEAQLFYYCRGVVDAAAPTVGAFKVNPSFFWPYGLPGMSAMTLVIEYVRNACPDVPLILDAKWNDVRHVAQRQAKATFETFGCDAVTAVPYGEVGGYGTLIDSGFTFLCAAMGKPSDPELWEVHTAQLLNGKKVWEEVVDNAAYYFNDGLTCGVVVSVCHPTAVQYAASANGKMPLLIPGIGAQGASLSNALFQLDSRRDSGRFLLVGGRSIMFAGDGSNVADDSRRQVEHLNDIIRTFRSS